VKGTIFETDWKESKEDLKTGKSGPTFFEPPVKDLPEHPDDIRIFF
jgi:hypothetical protein